MKNDTPLTKAQAAAQDLLNRTQDATKQFIGTLNDSTERFSADVTTGAREAVDSVQDTRDRMTAEFKAKAEPTAEQMSGAVNELISWARRNSERLIADLDEFRNGMEARLAPLTVVTKAELAELEARVAETEAALAKALKASSTKSTTAGGAKKPAGTRKATGSGTTKTAAKASTKSGSTGARKTAGA